MEKKVRFYPNLVKAVIRALQEIFVEGKQSDQVVRALLLQHKKWGARDRKFISGTIYDIVRWYRLLYETLGVEPKEERDWWQMFAVLQIWRGIDLPPWNELEDLDVNAVEERLKIVSKNPAINASFPDWMVKKGLAAYGEEWSDLMKELNQPAALVIRVNTLKTTKDQLGQALQKEGVGYENMDGDALLIPDRKRLTHFKIFRQGWFEIQDYSSQLVAPLLGVESGMTVIDACAGAGGKALHIAALMGNKGRIIAMDVSKRKLAELEKRAKRAGVDIIETYLIHPNEKFNKFEGVADRLLLDVPCSGTGTIRRSPGIKWKLKQQHIDRHTALQVEILNKYPTMLKKEGQMVYATCSILPEENTDQVNHFLTTTNQFTLDEEKQLLPTEGHDGFYMARIKKGLIKSEN